MMSQPVLHTPRLHLKPITPTDADAFYEIWGDPEVIWWGHLATIADAELFISQLRSRYRSDRTGWWLLLHRDTGEAVGDAVLQLVPRPSGELELGWHLARAHWGHGYATEAAKRLVRFAFTDLKVAELVADIALDNDRSNAVARRLGMAPRPETVKRGGLTHRVWELLAHRAPPAPGI